MTHLSVPSFWRLNKAKYGLIGAVCKDCGKICFPPRSVCTVCGGKEFDKKALADSGQILSWTTIHVPPEGFEAPYTVAIVRLAEGVSVSGQVVGNLENIAIGAPVMAVFRKLGENRDGLILYGFKFELI